MMLHNPILLLPFLILSLTHTLASTASCENDADWKDKKQGLGCDVISVDPMNRCHWSNATGFDATNACPEACNEECNPLSVVLTIGIQSHSNLRVPSVIEASATACTNDPNWKDKKQGRGCDVVSEDPMNRCLWTNSAGTNGTKACAGFCDSTCTAEEE